MMKLNRLWFLPLVLAIVTAALAATDPLGDLVTLVRWIAADPDLTTAAKVEKLRKFKPITVTTSATITDIVPTTVTIEVPAYRQSPSGRWVACGTTSKQVPALQINMRGDNQVLEDSPELIGPSDRSFTVTKESDRNRVITWLKGDVLSWPERVTVLDTGRLRAVPLVGSLADIKRTPKVDQTSSVIIAR